MAEQFLTLMAEYDDATQQIITTWHEAFARAGLASTHTKGIPHHISLATFSLEQEADAMTLTQRIAREHAPIQLGIYHLGIFPGGKVLFAAPQRTPELSALQRACGADHVGGYPWTPHTTLFMGEWETVRQALPVAVETFRPLNATLTRLHLCAFWPPREIVAVDLHGGSP